MNLLRIIPDIPRIYIFAKCQKYQICKPQNLRFEYKNQNCKYFSGPHSDFQKISSSFEWMMELTWIENGSSWLPRGHDGPQIHVSNIPILATINKILSDMAIWQRKGPQRHNITHPCSKWDIGSFWHISLRLYAWHCAPFIFTHQFEGIWRTGVHQLRWMVRAFMTLCFHMGVRNWS